MAVMIAKRLAAHGKVPKTVFLRGASGTTVGGREEGSEGGAEVVMAQR